MNHNVHTYTVLSGLANKIPGARSTNELLSYLSSAQQDLELQGLVFTSYAGDGWAGGDDDAYKFLAACPAAFCQQYTAKHWYAIDPCLTYSQVNSSVCTLSTIEPTSEGQRAMLEAARQAGFASGLVVPVHGPKGRSRMGVLYVGASDPLRFAGTARMAESFIYKGVADSLLTWFEDQARNTLMKRIELTEEDIEYLRLAHMGMPSREIATIKSANRAAVDQRFARLAAKMGVANRKAAAGLCFEAGVL